MADEVSSKHGFEVADRTGSKHCFEVVDRADVGSSKHCFEVADGADVLKRFSKNRQRKNERESLSITKARSHSSK
ncbi:chlorohydrolase [Streptococcus pneumoniae]|nr:chlorohydrolase [Streptococcus pneumoniae]